MLKRLTLLVLLLAGMMISFTACSSDSSTEPTTPGVTTGPIPNDQQAQAATATVENIDDMVATMGDGMNMMLGNGIPGKSGKTPPALWSAGADNWYIYNDYLDSNTTLKLRFTPNIWAGNALPPYAYDTVTKFELNLNSVVEEDQNDMLSSIGMIYDLMCEYTDNTKTFVNGHNNLNFVLKMTSAQYTFDQSFHWNMSYDNVSVSDNDKTAHWTFSSTWPYSANQQTHELLWTNLTGEFKFNATGVGVLDSEEQYLAGKCWTNGNLFIKFYYNGTNGWYTIAAQNFATQVIWNPWNGKNRCKIK